MLILDTDHVSVLQHEGSEAALRLMARLTDAADDVATTSVTAEEQMRGWLAVINKQKAGRAQVPYYERLARLLTFYTKWTVFPFDPPAAQKFDELRA
jgi:tRNA(fMet)-specific endonuclease VapC